MCVIVCDSMYACVFICMFFIYSSRCGRTRVCIKCVKVNVREPTFEPNISGDTARFVGFLSQVYVQKSILFWDPSHIHQAHGSNTFERSISGRGGSLWGFLRSHPDYANDSVVSDSMAYDLVKACNEIALGYRSCPELLGDIKIEPITRWAVLWWWCEGRMIFCCRCMKFD